MTRPARTMVLLFFSSLLLRLLVFFPVARWDVALLYDELGYLERAMGWREILSALGGLDAVASEDLSRAYGGGHWPPLHSLVLAAGSVLVEPARDGARLVMVFVSSLTTPLVFRLTREMATGEEAWAAAGWHLLYPTFWAYSHYLWSETTYICLLLAVVLAALRVAAAKTRRGEIMRAAVTGAILGLALLTRAAALPFLLVVPAWLVLSLGGRRRALAAAGAALAAALAVVSPWQAALTVKEGRFVPLTTLGGYNCALGNNPWVPGGYGSSWGHETSKARLFAAMQERARAESISWESAAFGLAIDEIRERPGLAIRRGIERLRMLWAPDFFPLRHLLGAVYPPLPPPLAAFLALFTVAGYLALVTVSLLGLAGAFRGRGLIAGMVVAGMAPAALTFGVSRLHLPLLALLLPAAGRGTVSLLGYGGRRVEPAAAIAALLVCVLSLGTLPRVVGLYLIPSSYYGPLVDRVGRRLGASVTFSDRIALRSLNGELTVEIVGDHASFLDGTRRKILRSSSVAAELTLDIVSAVGEPLEISLGTPGGRSVRVRPIAREAWRRWLPAGLSTVEYTWLGAGPSPL